MKGRIVMIFYGLFGIPLNGIVMVTLGGMFGRRVNTKFANNLLKIQIFQYKSSINERKTYKF